MNKYSLKTPFFAMAPMANITTYPFASQVAKYGADLVWTPMVHSEAVIHNPEEVLKIVDFKEIPDYIVQIIGSEPESMAQAVQIITSKLNPVGIDINFACPDKNIVKSGCGGFIMGDPELMIQIIDAVRKVTNLPISVKTRAGYDNLDDIFKITELLKDKVDMLTVHPRTVKSGFVGKADWDILKKLKEKHPGLLLVGSGDVESWQDALAKQKETGVDGVMIGRGALGKPWIFKEIKEQKDHDFNLVEVNGLALDLAQKADAIWGQKGITESKKHFAWYFKGFDGAGEYRKRLMAVNNLEDVSRVLT